MPTEYIPCREPKLRRAIERIDKAELVLGPLTMGQMVDLILDNDPTVRDSNEGREIVNRAVRMRLASSCGQKRG